MIKYHSYFSALIGLCMQTGSYAQSHRYDLSFLARQGGLQVQNRTISALSGEKGLRFSAAEGDGVAWLEGIEFSNGTIELDIRGKDVLQQSFVGVAFHAVSKDSLEAVYFRPFNFRSSDSLRKTHMVQYVYHPDFTWDRLRNERTGVFEKPVSDPPTPVNWFHARIVVRYPQVKVYVNNQLSPCLVINEWSNRQKGRIGLWVGNNSDGDFANLVITNE
jgi:hypothetical protein